MSQAITNTLPADAASAAADRQRAKAKELAAQFEAMLLTQMLRDMRRSMLSDDRDSGLGSETMTETMDSELALSLSRSSGMGLADFLVRAIERQTGTAPAARPPAAELPAVEERAPAVTATPAAAGQTVAPVEVKPPSGHVTSGFGWRNDPITGRVRFHKGSDVRMAYGEDVRGAAGGRVTFVGRQGGYGLTVVLDHGGGVETRYAHLSSAAVRQGDAVESGQVIAQSGNSGRSTGPHLHFEVLNNGRAVEPESMPGLLAAATASD